MPELAFEAAVVFGVVGLLVALVGVPSRAEPVCRACAADARLALRRRAADLDDAEVTCGCGRSLTRRGGVRWRGRRRPRAVVFVSIALLSIGIAGLLMGVVLRGRGLEWEDLKPVEPMIVAVEADAATGVVQTVYPPDQAEWPSLARRLKAGWLDDDQTQRIAWAAASTNFHWVPDDATDFLDYALESDHTELRTAAVAAILGEPTLLARRPGGQSRPEIPGVTNLGILESKRGRTRFIRLIRRADRRELWPRTVALELRINGDTAWRPGDDAVDARVAFGADGSLGIVHGVIDEPWIIDVDVVVLGVDGAFEQATFWRAAVEQGDADGGRELEFFRIWQSADDFRALAEVLPSFTRTLSYTIHP